MCVWRGKIRIKHKELDRRQIQCVYQCVTGGGIWQTWQNCLRQREPLLLFVGWITDLTSRGRERVGGIKHSSTCYITFLLPAVTQSPLPQKRDLTWQQTCPFTVRKYCLYTFISHVDWLDFDLLTLNQPLSLLQNQVIVINMTRGLIEADKD